MSIDNQQASLVWEQMAKIQAAETAVAADREVPTEIVGANAVKLKFLHVASNKATTPGGAGNGN